MKKLFTKTVSSVLLFAALGLAAQNERKSQRITFKENKGQVCDQFYKPRPDVLFSGLSKNLTYHLLSNGISYQITKIDTWKIEEDPKTLTKNKLIDQYSIYRTEIRWINSNANPIIEKGEALEGHDNYYLQQCPNGATNVLNYKDITYKNIYNGIDLKWYEKDSELEYDFIVSPYADVNQIKLEISGAKKLDISKNGELQIVTPYGTIIEKAPIAFQSGKKIEAQWAIKNNTAYFIIGNYDHHLPLIIDPAARLWGTYYGSAGTVAEESNFCTSDLNGNVFIGGRTGSNAQIATVGSHQTTMSGANDAFIVLFNNSGVRLWGTYYGGATTENGLACATFSNTFVYLSGQTNSTGTVLATVGSHQTNQGGSFDAFLVKLNSANGTRVWGTYYGGSGVDRTYGCTTDASDNIYICGETVSTNGTVIATSGAHQPTLTAAGAFLAKFNSTGVRQWGTYYGDAGDIGTGLTIDNASNVIMCGYSIANSSLISTPGSHQPTYGGSNDGFLVKFNSAGVRQWATYYGGVFGDRALTCAFGSGGIYLGGFADSNTGTVIATAGSHQSNGNTNNGFLAKFDNAGIRQWGTYYSSTSGGDIVYATSIDATGNIYIAGKTGAQSGTNIATPFSHQDTPGGPFTTTDAFLAKFNSSGVRQWGTYYGGIDSEIGYGCAVGLNSEIYLAGQTKTPTSTLIATPGSHQPAFGGGTDDAFVTKLYDCQNIASTITGSTNICAGQSTTLTYSGSGFTTYTWTAGPNTNSIAVSPTTTTNYTVTASTSTAQCKYPFVVTVSVNLVPSTTIAASSNSICSGNTVTLTASGATTYSWSNSSTLAAISVSPNTSTTYTAIGYNGICANSKTISINVTPTPTVFISSTNYTLCSGNTASLLASGAATYSWVNGPNTASYAATPTAATVYSVIGTTSLCSTTSTLSIGYIVTPTITINSSALVICPGGSVTLSIVGAASTYSWNTGPTTTSIVVSPSSNTTYIAAGFNSICYGLATTTIAVSNSITVSASVSNPTICAGESTTITTTGAATYTWSTGSNSTSIVVSPTTTTSYSVSGQNGSCSGNASLSIVVDPCTGIKENNGDVYFLIYPNPSNQIVNIEVENISGLQIIDVLGKIVFEGKLQKLNNTINISNLSNGVYYFKIKQGDANSTRKIIKQ
jgi:hypothetical protein